VADPTVFRHDGTWYLYASACQAWVSSDLLTWEYRRVDTPADVVGPTIEEHNGYFYLSGNGGGAMYRSSGPLGPWEDMGPICDRDGKRVHWADLAFFKDDDGTVYVYHHSGSGVGRDGIFVTPLDPSTDFTRTLAPSKSCFSYNPEHIWERWGDRNEFPDIAWIEAPWMTKHNGRYYLQYSGCGTEWTKYAIGVYTSDSPTGPFVYDEKSPILIETGGLLKGTGHHAMAQDDGGNWWMIYHVLFHNSHRFDRRLAMDPVGFDEQGHMFVAGPTETPQLAPGENPTPTSNNDAGWLALSVNKPTKASSSAPGRTPDYSNDNYVRTWWEAAHASLPQSLTVDLQGVFDIHACRLIFSVAGWKKARPAPVRYTVEVSNDGETYAIALDRRDADTVRSIDYRQFAPARGRHVRLTVTGGPEGVPIGVIDFALFGLHGSA
jgi:hypothetical protein